jgi:hypothetical protein
MNEHPDYLTMAQIVNGNDDLSMNATDDEMTAYIADAIGMPTAEIAGAAQDEAFSVLAAAKTRASLAGDSDLRDVIASTAWSVGFFYGLRVDRGITTDMFRTMDPFLDVDQMSVAKMASGRAQFILTTSNDERQIAMACWLDGVMTGIHFDGARP